MSDLRARQVFAARLSGGPWFCQVASAALSAVLAVTFAVVAIVSMGVQSAIAAIL
jgi:hypothetical protein